MSEQLTIGELFAGYGGLGMAVEEVFGARLSWYAEFEEAPSKILAHHYPGITNYGDVTAVDWATVPPVDIISGGSPCQDVSLAGRRAGMTEGTRSNLWGAMRTAIETIRPKYVVWENVRGALSARATSDSDMEPDSGLLGDRSGGHLRALGRVLGDLADLGYDAQWCGLRASDVGAPHQRFRVFVLATRADVQDTMRSRSGGRRAVPGTRPSGEPDTAPHGTDHRHGSPGTDVGLLEGSTDADRQPWGQGWEPTPRQAQGWQALARPRRHGGAPAPDAEGRGRRVLQRLDHGPTGGEVNAPGDASTAHSRAAGASTDWGPYAAAIHRWERLRGPAPAPTELTVRGKHRLSPLFVEWMMGLPAGWVTSIDISRNAQLKALGNGVVPQQAAAALGRMLTALDVADAA